MCISTISEPNLSLHKDQQLKAQKSQLLHLDTHKEQ